MKDSYVHRSEEKSGLMAETGSDWVVVRRRNAPEQAVQPDGRQTAAPQPAPVDETPVETAEAPRSALEIMRRAMADMPVDGGVAAEDETVLASDDLTCDKVADHDDWAAEPDCDKDLTDEDLADEDLADEDLSADDLADVAETAGQEQPVAPAPFALGAEHAVALREPEPVADHAPSAEEIWASLARIQVGARLDGQAAQAGLPSIVEYFRADPIAKGFDLLRTRLVRTIRAYGWRRIAVVAPTSGCGTTFTAVNLALSLSRVPGSRTILMDMNQRNPGVASALGARNPHRLDDFLLGETGFEDYLVRPSKTLAVGLADAPNALAAEILHDPLTGEVLDEMVDMLEPDLVIYDMPPMLAHDDMAAFLPQVDGVLLVADGTQTLPEHISACERVLEGQTQLLGVVLNRGRAEGKTDVLV